MALGAYMLVHFSPSHVRRWRLRELVTSQWKRWDLNSPLTTSVGLFLLFWPQNPLRAGGGGLLEGWMGS